MEPEARGPVPWNRALTEVFTCVSSPGKGWEREAERTREAARIQVVLTSPHYQGRGQMRDHASGATHTEPCQATHHALSTHSQTSLLEQPLVPSSILSSHSPSLPFLLCLVPSSSQTLSHQQAALFLPSPLPCSLFPACPHISLPTLLTGLSLLWFHSHCLCHTTCQGSLGTGLGCAGSSPSCPMGSCSSAPCPQALTGMLPRPCSQKDTSTPRC